MNRHGGLKATEGIPRHGCDPNYSSLFHILPQSVLSFQQDGERKGPLENGSIRYPCSAMNNALSASKL